MLEPLEISILRELRAPNHSGWLTAEDIADRIGAPGWETAAVLNGLKHKFLARRGGTTLGHWRQWEITEAGMVELAAADQLKLIR